MAAVETAEPIATDGASFWALREDNEWEGESWTVYFEAPTEYSKELKRLKRLIRAQGDESPYELRRVKEIPSHLIAEEDPEDEDLEDDEDYDEDCDDDFDDEEGYHPAHSVYEFKPDNLPLAISYFERGDSESDDDDPLYKLGFFR